MADAGMVTGEKRRAEALRAADEHFGRLERSPEFAGVAGVALPTDRNPLLRLVFADGYLRGQDTVEHHRAGTVSAERRIEDALTHFAIGRAAADAPVDVDWQYVAEQMAAALLGGSD